MAKTRYYYKDGNPNGQTYREYDGVLHRLDGPAIEMPDGHFVWYKNGLVHRECGPADYYPIGTIYQDKEYNSWYVNGNRIGDTETGMTNEKFLRLMKMKVLW